MIARFSGVLLAHDKTGGIHLMTTAQIISIVIFVVVMALIVSEKIHRTTAALCGAGRTHSVRHSRLRY